MLKGYYELCRFEATNAIVEGDTFSAIQWGSGKLKCPWRLVDWVEEIHHITAQLKYIFLRDANNAADI